MLESVEEEEDSGFGNAGRIMQVGAHAHRKLKLKIQTKTSLNRFSELQGS